MSREDVHENYEYGDHETVELGFDHNGQKQWFYSSREGWEETGTTEGCLVLDREYYKVGTKITLKEPLY
jgi:hypothetical protein